MTLRALVELAGMTGLATLNVSMWTLRVALAARGSRALASLVAGFEALVFALVFGAVVSNLDRPARIVAYAVGVAAGTLVGITADDWLSTAHRHPASSLRWRTRPARSDDPAGQGTRRPVEPCVAPSPAGGQPDEPATSCTHRAQVR